MREKNKKVLDIIVVGSGIAGLNFIDKYLENASEVFQLIASNKDNLEALLKSEISHSGFQRLN